MKAKCFIKKETPLSVKKLSTFIVLFFVISYSTPTKAMDIEEIKTKLRDFCEKTIGPDITNKIFGPKPIQVVMPPLPILEKKPTDVSFVEINDKGRKEFNSDEMTSYNYSFVKELFIAVRKTPGNVNDVAKWMNVLEQGGSREGVYRGLVLDSVYMGLENYDNPATDNVVNFMLEMMNKFVGQNINPEKLKGANFYSLKRILVEKLLEMMEELAKRDIKDAYSWYAIMSVDLAEKYPKAFQNSIRKNNDPLFHRAWALTMPHQFSKSEVLIKIHKVFNFLMP